MGLGEPEAQNVHENKYYTLMTGFRGAGNSQHSHKQIIHPNDWATELEWYDRRRVTDSELVDSDNVDRVRGGRTKSL